MPWLVSADARIVHASLFVFAFVWLSLGLGRRALRLLVRSGQASVGERAVLAFALGAGLLVALPFLLGVTGHLSELSLRIGLGVVVLAALPDLVGVARAAIRELRAFRRPDTASLVWVAALAPALLSAALLALVPSIDPDGLGYHLTVPKRWLALGSLGYLPTYAYSNTPMGVEMLFMLALSVAGDSAAKLVHFALGVGGGVGLFFAGRRLAGPAVGLAAVALYFVGPAGTAGLLGWAYVEGAVSLALGTSTLAWLIWFRTSESGWLRVAFVLAGIGVSFKLPAGLFPVALAALTFAVAFDRARKEQQAPLAKLVRLIPQILWVVLPALPWMTRAAWLTGNPVFPLFAGLFPTREYSAELGARFERYNRYMFWASGQSWSIEQRKLILAGFCLLLLLLAAFVFTRLRSFPARACLVVLTVTTLIQLAAVGLYVRYWMPVLAVFQLPLLSLFAVALSPPRRFFVWAALTAVASLAMARRNLTSAGSDASELVGLAFGLGDQRAFLRERLPLFPIYEKVNRELPADSRVMLSFYCGGFYLDRTTYCSDFAQGSLRLTTWPEFEADVRRLGVTHVLAPRELAIGAAPPPPGDLREREYQLVGRLINARGKLIASASDQGLYALAPAAAP